MKDSVIVDPSAKRSHIKLHQELKNALFLRTEEIPSNIVRLDCYVTIETTFGRKYKMLLVNPNEGDFSKGKLSVISPIGTALIGRSIGQIVWYCQPNGDEKIKILDISLL